MENYTDRFPESGLGEFFSVKVCGAGYQKYGRDAKWDSGAHDHYTIYYVISGKGCFKREKRIYSLKAGDSLLVLPNGDGLFRTEDGHPWECIRVDFEGIDVPFLLRASFLSLDLPLITADKHKKEISNYMNFIYNMKNGDYSDAVAMSGYLLLLFGCYIREAKKPARLSQTEKYAVRGADYISANYAAPITVGDIAAHIGISHTQLFRAFKAVLNQSPKEFLTDYRIRQACALLSQSGIAVSEVAERTGFNNSLYFSKAFHRQTGMSPTEYARLHRQKKDCD